MAYMGEGRHREQPAWASIGRRSLLPPLAARATTEKDRTRRRGDGVDSLTTALAAPRRQLGRFSRPGVELSSS